MPSRCNSTVVLFPPHEGVQSQPWVTRPGTTVPTTNTRSPKSCGKDHTANIIVVLSSVLLPVTGKHWRHETMKVIAAAEAEFAKLAE